MSLQRNRTTGRWVPRLLSVFPYMVSIIASLSTKYTPRICVGVLRMAHERNYTPRAGWPAMRCAMQRNFLSHFPAPCIQMARAFLFQTILPSSSSTPSTNWRRSLASVTTWFTRPRVWSEQRLLRFETNQYPHRVSRRLSSNGPRTCSLEAHLRSWACSAARRLLTPCSVPRCTHRSWRIHR